MADKKLDHAMRELRKAAASIKKPAPKKKNWADRLKTDVKEWLKAERAAVRAKAKQRKVRAKIKVKSFKTTRTKGVQRQLKRAGVEMKTDIDRWR